MDNLNILLFLTPKSELKFMYSNYSLIQGLQVMKYYGFTALPVVDKDSGKYEGSVSDSDFLHACYDYDINKFNEINHIKVIDIIDTNKYKAVHCDTSLSQLLQVIMTQNFVPVVDDRDCFMGIITRRRVIQYYSQQIKYIENNKDIVIYPSI